MTAAFHFVDVFTAEGFRGNPLAVFPDAGALDSLRMALLAREIGFSETVFVLPTERPDCDFRLRIFTPAEELPFAGHPTLGAAFVLDRLGRVRGGRLTVEEGVGPVEVWRSAVGWTLRAPPPRPGPIWERTDLLARLLGLREADLDTRYDCQTWRSGLDFLYIPLRSREALRRSQLDPSVLREALSQVPLPPLYLCWLDGDLAHTRMFAPQLGVAEDPATGSAAGPLCAWLAASGQRELDPDGWVRLTVHQGEDLGRPSVIHAAARYAGQGWGAAEVGGPCVWMATGEFTL